MARLTIHTATYNRDYILEQAYISLTEQTNKDFEWIITDDGSTDTTEELVKKWMSKDNGFEIVYNKLQHVGIPRALNSGVMRSSTKWFMMLDSDDKILPQTVEKVMSWLDEIENDDTFVGVGFSRIQPDGSYMKKQTPLIPDNPGYVDASNIERYKYNLNMDMCEVHRVSLLKKYPFQYWETEKYAPEQLNYNAIALAGYKFRWRKDGLYICDYLPDGQTNDTRLVKNNPMGFAMMHNQNLLIHKTFKERLFDASQMTALSLYSGNPGYLKKTNSVFYTIISLPLGFVISLRRKKQFKNLK